MSCRTVVRHQEFWISWIVDLLGALRLERLEANAALAIFASTSDIARNFAAVSRETQRRSRRKINVKLKSSSLGESILGKPTAARIIEIDAVFAGVIVETHNLAHSARGIDPDARPWSKTSVSLPGFRPGKGISMKPTASKIIKISKFQKWHFMFCNSYRYHLSKQATFQNFKKNKKLKNANSNINEKLGTRTFQKNQKFRFSYMKIICFKDVPIIAWTR